MKTTEKNMTPYLVVHPGELLQDELEERGLSQTEFSEIIGRPNRTVNEIIKGKRSITPETAQVIAAALGTSPDFWLSMQSEYDLFLLRQKSENKEEEVKERLQLYSLFPVSELIKRGYISRKKKIDDLTTSILNLFESPALEAYVNAPQYAHFRTSTAGDITHNYLKAWVHLGCKKAKTFQVKKFNSKALEDFAPEIKKFSRKEDGIELVLKKLNDIGVRVIFLPHFSKTRVDGAVCWIQEEPVIILSLRYDRIDNFYFTLLHEIGHILKHPNKSFWDDISNLPKTNKIEQEADEFANKALGIEEIVEKFSFAPESINANLLNQKSAAIEIHPGLLVGKLQHERILGYNQYRQGLVKIKHTIPSPYLMK